MRDSVVRLFLAGFFVFSGHALGEARNCTVDEAAAADKQLFLNERDSQISIKSHLPWGIPSDTENSNPVRVLVQRDYVIGYDPNLLIPLWAAHKLPGKLGKIDRINCFRRDPRLDKPYAALPSDYAEPVFDRGHLTPNGDMSFDLIPELNSFMYTNMTPQYCQFNRGVWQILEMLVRAWATIPEQYYVITGSVFDRNGDGVPDGTDMIVRMKSSNGKSRVAVPSHFYKILIRRAPNGNLESLSFLMPNNQTDLDGTEAIDYIRGHIATIPEIERIAGRKLLPDLTGYPLESSGLWELPAKLPHSLVDAKCRAKQNPY